MPKFHEIHSHLKRTTDATTEPISVETAMLHCRCDAAEEIPWFNNAIATARQYCEAHTHRQCLSATWTLYLDQFPSDAILLGVNPVSAVSSIVYNDSGGTSQTLSSTNYRTDMISEPARIVPAYGYVWPVTRGQVNDICVTFTAGYGSAATSVPPQIKQAMLLLLAHFREHPEAVTSGNVTSVPFGVDALLDSVCWSRVH